MKSAKPFLRVLPKHLTCFSVICLAVLSAASARAQTATNGVTWNNTGSQWTNGTSWFGDVAPTNSATVSTNNIATFSNAAVGNNIVNLGSPQGIYGVVFTAGANAYTFTGSALTIRSTPTSISNGSASTQTFSNKIINTSASSAVYGSAAGGSLVFAGGIDLSSSTNPRTVTLGQAGNITVSGTIADGGGATGAGVTVNNTGLTLFSGNNTYSGTTLVSSGARLQLGNAGALGSNVGLTRVSSGGAIDLNGQNIVGEGLTNAGTGVSTSGSLYNSSASAATWSGNITPSADSTIKATNGSITLSGGIDLNNNTNSSRTLTLDGTGGIIVSGNISNSFAGSTGGLTIGGTNGTITLSGSNSYSGLTTLTNTYTLRVTSTDSLSSNSSLEAASASARTPTLDLAAAGNYKMNGYQGGNINLLATNGASSLTFTNTGAGNFVVGGSRTITATNSAVTFDGSVDISPTTTNKTFTVVGNSDFTFNGSVLTTNTAFSSEFRASSTGRTTLNASNNYDGLTTVSAGATLRLANSFAMGVTNGLTNTVVSGGALELSNGITVDGEILDLNGSGVSDGGALRNISGNNTYNGLIELNSTNRINSDAGTLTVSSFANNLSSTRSLFVGGAGNTEIAGALDGSSTGRLVKDGTGTLTISGANTVNGGITVGAGSLIVSSTGSIIEPDSSVIISNGAYLGYNGTTALRTASVSIEAGGTLELGTSGSMRFVVTTNGANTVSGAGAAIFKGTFNPEINAAATNSGSSWPLVSVSSSSYPGSFQVAGFTNSGGTWTCGSNGVTYQFVQSTGILSVAGSAPVSAYDSWLTNYPSLTGTNTNGTADPDGDGFNNDLEFAFDGNPTFGTASLLTVTSSGSNAVFNFVASTNPAAVLYTVQATTNLSTSPWADDIGVTASVTNSANQTNPPILLAPEYVRREFSLPATNKSFYRVKATIAP